MSKQSLFLAFFVFCLSIVSSAQTVSPSNDKKGIASGDSIYLLDKIEVDASVDKDLWQKHIEKKMEKAIKKTSRQGIPVGRYIINVGFIIEKDGTISQAKALNDPGYGLAQIAEEIIKSGPKWKPGERGGKKVISYKTQPIHFTISK